MDSDRDLYEILQVDPAAEPEVVQAAFKRLALKYHPDKNPSLDANRRMQELNEAYGIISDPAQRAAYDQQRRAALAARRRAEEAARYQAEAERRAEAARRRKEQMAAQRRAENERQARARAAAAQRRVEYEQQIKAQMAAQMRAKRERQQREWEQPQAGAQEAGTQQAAGQPLAPIEMPLQEPAAMPEAQVRVEVEQSPIDMFAQEPVVMPEAQVQVEVEQSPPGRPHPGETERQQIALMRSRQALQDEIFKLDYGLTDAAEQVKYWSSRRIPWEIAVPSGLGTKFLIGGTVTITALLLAGFMSAFGGGISWAAYGLVGIGTGWWTWRKCVSVLPAEYLVEAWSEIKRSRELRQKKLKAELAQLESTIQAQAGAPSGSFDK